MNGAVLANLRLIHRAAGFFWIEDSAYRDAKAAPKSTGSIEPQVSFGSKIEALFNKMQVHKSTGNGKTILLLLGIIFLLLRTRIRK